MMHIFAAGLLIPYTVQCTYLVFSLDKVMNLWSNDVNLEYLHKMIRVSVSYAVLQIISHVGMLCCVYYILC